MPMPSGEIDDDLPEPSTVVRNFMLKQAAKKVGKLGATVAGSVLGIPGVSLITDGRAAYKTHVHLQNLEQIKKSQTCTCSKGCGSIADYAIHQKHLKKSRKMLGATPGIGIAETIRSKGKALYKISKSTKSKERKQKAMSLYNAARDGCTLAQALVLELCNVTDHTEVTKEPNGWMIIGMKLAST